MSIETMQPPEPDPEAAVLSLIENGWPLQTVHRAARQFDGIPLEDHYDYAQELSIRMWEHPEFANDEGYGGAYLIASRIMIHEYRKTQTIMRGGTENARAKQKLNEPETLPEMGPIEPAIPDHAEAVLMHEAGKKLLARLPSNERRAIVAYYYYKCDTPETAMALDIPTGTAKRWLSEGRARLREWLKAQGICSYEEARRRLL
jgi:RNA polymerase sigma factor (sigma-70 family)